MIDHIAQETLALYLHDEKRSIDEVIDSLCSSDKVILTDELRMALNLLMAKNPKKVQLVMERDGAVDFFVGPMIKIAKANIPPAKLRSIILDYIRGNKNE